MLIYVAHPFSGLQENKEKVEAIIREFTAIDDSIAYVSPIHTFGHMYHEVEYNTGIMWCIDLLKKCDAVVFCGDYQSSKGCAIERDIADLDDIDLYTEDEWRQKLCKSLTKK